MQSEIQMNDTEARTYNGVSGRVGGEYVCHCPYLLPFL